LENAFANPKDPIYLLLLPLSKPLDLLMHDNRRKKWRRTLIIYLESGKFFGRQLFFLGVA
jgi:hypothetical protein